MVSLYTEQELSNGFIYPQLFLNMVSATPVIDLEPWWFICEFKESAEYWFSEIKKQYPEKCLIPFAKYSHTDDIACFDGSDTSGDPKVYYIHAFASPGWEERGSVANFNEWFKLAQEESARYKIERAEEDE